MHFATSITDLVGNTPLVRLNRVTDGLSATVLAKLEYFNPGGSSKDRPARAMIRAAEAAGLLKPGGTIIEPTSGNTGVGLAMAAAELGYRCILVMPDKFAVDKRLALTAYGAEVVLVPTSVEPDDPRSYYSVAARLLEEIPGSFGPNQFANPAAPAGHYETTGPEIWRDTDGRVTQLVAGVGTGGTMTGTARYLREQLGDRLTVVGADPHGSIYSGGDAHGYDVEGVGEDWLPPNYDPTLIDRWVRVSDAESFAMTRRLAREEGLLVGGSSGMAVVAALDAAQTAGPDDVIVAILPDGGRGYLRKIFSDDWMTSRGFDVSDTPGRLVDELDWVSGLFDGMEQRND